MKKSNWVYPKLLKLSVNHKKNWIKKSSDKQMDRFQNDLFDNRELISDSSHELCLKFKWATLLS